MRLHIPLLTALACTFAAPAQAYEIDPLTREPLASVQAQPLGQSMTPQSEPTAREVVAFPTRHPAGSIVVSTTERRLYYVLGGGQAIRYAVGVGRPGFTWGGSMMITRKAEWPSWTPPAEMLRRRPDLPRFMKGGLENPMGARGLYLGSSLYRIHGSNEPETIGTGASSGCIRMHNADVIDLYERTRIGTMVYVQR